MSLEELERAEQERMLCHCLDKQPTLLPKLRRGPPLYHQLRLAWSEAEDRSVPHTVRPSVRHFISQSIIGCPPPPQQLHIQPVHE